MLPLNPPDHYGNDWEIGEFLHRQKVPFFEGCIIKYLLRWRRKDGIRDLQKARNYLEKLIELSKRSDRGTNQPQESKPRSRYQFYRGAYFDMDSLPAYLKGQNDSGVSGPLSRDSSDGVCSFQVPSYDEKHRQYALRDWPDTQGD